MAKPFIPNRDSEFDTWLDHFAGKIAMSPGTYGVSAGDAAELSAAQVAWHAAFATASAPSTRTVPAIRAKDQARAAAVLVVRRLGAIIRPNPAVSDSLKLSLGLKLRKATLSRTQAPTEHPVLVITGLAPASHEVSASEAGEYGSRAKHAGAASLLVVRTIGDSPANNPEDATFLALATRTRLTSTFTRNDGGRFATYFARWANAKGQLGPWSAPVSMRIAA